MEKAVEYLTNYIIKAAKFAIPTTIQYIYANYSKFIIEQIAEKRSLRGTWKNIRFSNNKRLLNRATRKFTRLLAVYKNEFFSKYLNLTPTKDTD